MRSTIDECFRERLLRKETPDTEKAMNSVRMSEDKLGKARESLEKGIPDAVIIFAYSSMFHASRALLFRDGITERSHICIILYLRENYVKPGRLEQSFVNSLNSLRMERHNEFYGLAVREISEQEASDALYEADEFLKEVKGLLEQTS